MNDRLNTISYTSTTAKNLTKIGLVDSEIACLEVWPLKIKNSKHEQKHTGYQASMPGGLN